MPAAIPLVISAAATTYSAIEQNKSARRAAQVDTATAQYNARYDQALAKQIDLDTIQNIRTQRADDAVYLSRMHASYADAGVLATTGSALDAQITTAGRMEQRLQQEWVNSQQQQQQAYSKAKVGILEGQAQATADRASGTIALLNGGARLASMAYQGYESGAFSFGS